jgi:hypothetical protein
MTPLVDYWYTIFVDCLDFLLSPLKNKLPKICNGSQQLTTLVLLVNEFFEAHSESIFTIENQTVGLTLNILLVWCGASGSKILILLYLRS